MKRKHGRLLGSNKKTLGWIGVGTMVILLYAALRLTINYLAAPSLPERVHDIHAWFAVLLYCFLYVPTALALSLCIVSWSGIDR